MPLTDIQNGVYQIWTDGSDVELVKIVDGRVTKRYQGSDLDQLKNLHSSAVSWFREDAVTEVDSETLDNFAAHEDVNVAYIRVFRVPGE